MRRAFLASQPNQPAGGLSVQQPADILVSQSEVFDLWMVAQDDDQNGLVVGCVKGTANSIRLPPSLLPPAGHRQPIVLSARLRLAAVSWRGLAKDARSTCYKGRDPGQQGVLRAFGPTWASKKGAAGPAGGGKGLLDEEVRGQGARGRDLGKAKLHHRVGRHLSLRLLSDLRGPNGVGPLPRLLLQRFRKRRSAEERSRARGRTANSTLSSTRGERERASRRRPSACLPPFSLQWGSRARPARKARTATHF